MTSRLAAALAVVLPIAALLPLVAIPAAAQEAAEGERLFRARCAACHAAGPGPVRIGPPLAGVVGRTAGSAEGARTSPALRQSGLVWSAQTLDAYLADPRRAVPGTTMTVALRDAGERAAVVAYLAGLAAAD